MVNTLNLESSGLSSSPGMVEAIVLCSWVRHLTLAISFSTQVYDWVSVHLMLLIPLQETCIPSMGESKYCWSLHAHTQTCEVL